MKRLLATGLWIGLCLTCLAQSPQEDQKQLAGCEKDYLAAKAALAKHPKDAAARARFSRAGDRFATATMTSSLLSPHIKYPKALHLYREVLKLDPTNHEASSNAALIESVYRSMHRPIPK